MVRMKVGTQKYSRVKIEGLPDTIVVPVTTDKPSIPEKMFKRWQDLVDLVARTLKVPSGQITRFTEKTLEIFAASQNTGNPFRNGDAASLGGGMFCETVVGRKQIMAVSDIRTSEFWKDNPFAGSGLLSYIGIPIEWEDGEVFGTFCLLDDKANSFSDVYFQFIRQFKDIIEADLHYLLTQEELKRRVTVQELEIRESHHRINNHFSMLIGYIQLQVAERESDRDLCDVLMDIRNRIRSISLIHDKLCISSEQTLPMLDVYITQLCEHIIADVASFKIALECAIDPLTTPVEFTVALGLIVAELVTNSVKYAFPGIAKPAITIRIRRTTEDVIKLEYFDNGIGFPEGFDISEKKTLGLTLVRLQVEQLHGDITVENRQGVHFTIMLKC